MYHDVVRLEDLEKLIDCSNVQVGATWRIPFSEFSLCILTLVVFNIYPSDIAEISFRPILLIAQKWCSSRNDLRIGSLKGLETIVLPVTGASKNLISTALLAAR